MPQTMEVCALGSSKFHEMGPKEENEHYFAP